MKISKQLFFGLALSIVLFACQDIFPAYQWYEASEELIKTDVLVDGEYALTHEVWVISINERMDQADGSILSESNLTNGRAQSTPGVYCTAG